MTEEIRTCPDCGEHNPARAKFCLECGYKFVKAAKDSREPSPTQERRLVTVLFADLSGFTAYSERADIEEARRLAHEAAEAMGEIVERYGGTVDKIIGDAVMAVFGAPTSHEDDPERAVRAALDMQIYAAEHKEELAQLQLTIGLNTGDAMFAPVGSGGQFTVIGDTVNTAARLQSAAGKGEILVGQATYAATETAVEYEAVAPIIAKNKAEPVPAWKAMSVKGVRSSRIASRTTWVGRGAEFERLWEIWEKVKLDGQPHTAYLVGPPGIGKSRLITEFLKRVEGISSVYWGRCLSYGEGITYWPVIEIIKDAAGIVQDDDPETVSTKLGIFLEELGTQDLDELRTMAVALANLVAAPTTPRGTYQATKISRGELHWGLRRVFQLLAAREPLVLVFEDLHWAEPTFLDLLDFLIEDTEIPLLILGSARPELKEISPKATDGRSNRRVIELAALSEEQSREVLHELAGEAGLTEKEIDKVLKAAGGNPLFLEETIRMLADLAMDRDAAGDKTAAPLSVPSNLRSLIGSRLDRLNALEKRAAQHASVIGHVFWSGAVAYLTEDGTQNDMSLDALEARDLVHEQQISSIAGEREWTFKHALIRDVAYDRLPKKERAKLHARSGEWIAALPGGEDDFAEIIAYHLEEACRRAAEVVRSGIEPPLLPAVRALTRAAEKAESREGTREAFQFYARAIDLVGDRMPETSAELRLRQTRALTALGQVEDATGQLEDVAVTARNLSRLDLRSRALAALANIYLARGQHAEARARFVEAETLARHVEDQPMQIRVSFGFAALRADEGKVEASARALEEAISMAQELGDEALLLEGHLRLGTTLINLGRLTRAEKYLEECVRLAASQGGLRAQADATVFLGIVKYYLGEYEEAERLGLQAAEWLKRTADRYVQVQNLLGLARIKLRVEEFEAAETLLEEALPIAADIGGWLLVGVHRYLAEVAARSGQTQKARQWADAAKEALPEEALDAHAAAALARAFAAAAEGNQDQARTCFEESLRLFEQQEIAQELGTARIAYARALSRFGESAAALGQLSLAREIFDRMGARGMVSEIDRELAAAAAS